MSKWTLEKIKACEEIKLGTSVTEEDYRLDIPFIRGKFVLANKSVMYRRDNNTLCDHGGSYDKFHFYRPDGSEILPPENEAPEKNKLYAFGFNALSDAGFGRIEWYTDALPRDRRRRVPKFDMEF